MAHHYLLDESHYNRLRRVDESLTTLMDIACAASPNATLQLRAEAFIGTLSLLSDDLQAVFDSMQYV